MDRAQLMIMVTVPSDTIWFLQANGPIDTLRIQLSQIKKRIFKNRLTE